mmetsp:Transcript_24495/g.82244  ORF Transcript_24495/g.82244 Transcript_24495/m.82244 type:complete len:224 (+) Transcript_24495:367-1038(+)
MAARAPGPTARPRAWACTAAWGWRSWPAPARASPTPRSARGGWRRSSTTRTTTTRRRASSRASDDKWQARACRAPCTAGRVAVPRGRRHARLCADQSAEGAEAVGTTWVAVSQCFHRRAPPALSCERSVTVAASPSPSRTATVRRQACAPPVRWETLPGPEKLQYRRESADCGTPLPCWQATRKRTTLARTGHATSVFLGKKDFYAACLAKAESSITPNSYSI